MTIEATRSLTVAVPMPDTLLTINARRRLAVEVGRWRGTHARDRHMEVR